MAPVRAAALDLDGTVVSGDELLPGARDAVAAIRARVDALCFVTNNPTVPPAEYAARLRALGVEAAPAEVVTAGSVTVAYLREHHADDAVLPIAGDAVVAQLADAGVRLVDDPAVADCIVAGFDDAFDYGDLRDALRAFERPGDVAFVGTDPDRAIPTADGPVPGSGAIIRAVAGVADRDPDAVLGKPSAETAAAVRECLGVPAAETVVVGDNPRTDVALANAAGMRSVRVRTGVDDPPADPAEEADCVVDDLAASVACFA